MKPQAEGTRLDRGLDPATGIYHPNRNIIGYLCRRIWDVSIARLQSGIPNLNVTAGQMGTLVLIAHNPGITPSDISRVRGYDKSTITIALNYLARKKLITRRSSPSDRRSFTLHVTKSGGDFLAAAEPRSHVIDRRLTRSLSAGERERLVRLLARVYESECVPRGERAADVRAAIGSMRNGTAIAYPNLNLVGYLCRRVWDVSVQMLRAAFPQLPVTDGQMGTLVLVACNPGITPTQICRAQGCEKATITSALDTLARKRLVTRRLSTIDRRSFEIHLTKTGSQLYATLAPIAQMVDHRLTNSLSADERGVLFDLLSRIFARECDPRPATPRATGRAAPKTKTRSLRPH